MLHKCRELVAEVLDAFCTGKGFVDSEEGDNEGGADSFQPGVWRIVISDSRVAGAPSVLRFREWGMKGLSAWKCPR